jgi:hypothetical protein
MEKYDARRLRGPPQCAHNATGDLGVDSGHRRQRIRREADFFGVLGQ